MDEYDDSSLVRLCLSGQPKAFERLIERYQKTIFNVVYRMCSNFDDAEDITQSVFIKVYSNLSTYNDKYKFYSWIYRIAVNESLNHLNQKKRLGDLSETLISAEKQPDQVYNQQEISRTIQRALMELDPDYRILLVLRHFNNCSYQDMSTILSVPEKKVKSRLYSARQLLRQILISKDIKEND